MNVTLRALLHRYGVDERGQAELFLIALLAFMIALLATGHRIVVQ